VIAEHIDDHAVAAQLGIPKVLLAEPAGAAVVAAAGAHRDDAGNWNAEQVAALADDAVRLRAVRRRIAELEGAMAIPGRCRFL
jgi:hypothetical protein